MEQEEKNELKKEEQEFGEKKIEKEQPEKTSKETDKKTEPIAEKKEPEVDDVKEINISKETIDQDKVVAKKQEIEETPDVDLPKIDKKIKEKSEDTKESKVAKKENEKVNKPKKRISREKITIEKSTNSADKKASEEQVELEKKTESDEKSVSEEKITSKEEVSSEKIVEDSSKPKEEEPKEKEVPEKKVSSTEFDWDLYENDEVEYEEKERKEMEAKYTSTLSVINEMEVIKAKVANITDKDVVLNIGYKSDGLVPRSEFKHFSELNIGDEVEVLVESTEGPDGQIILSHKKARAESAWQRISGALESGEILKGYIKDRTKGGMVVDMLGLDAFLPGSQLDIKPVQDYDAYVGTEMDLKVVKLNPAFRNIVVSHKAIIEQDIEQQRHEILSKLEKGQVLEGIVKNLTSFGVFVDLGGVDGLIHITDVSWGRINHPNVLLEIGQKINVVVLDYDEEKNRISLGMKQLTQHPWETLPKDIQEGSVIKGKVVNIEDYGAFIEIFPGVEGLVHVSEMTWSQHLKSPSDYIKLNDEAEVKVLSINRDERKLSLGIKQLKVDPWINIIDKYPKDSEHLATIKNITNFGLFLELEEGIDGLIHISDLSWTKKYNHPSEFAKVGAEIKFVILELDPDNRRLSLGHKQLEEDPWDTFKDIFAVESLHEGSIAKLEDKGAIITLPYNVAGYCPNKHLFKEDNSKPGLDEVLEFKVIEFDRGNRKILVSHTLVWKDSQKVEKEDLRTQKKKSAERTRKAISHVRSKVKKTTLASELDILQEIKDKMIADEKKVKKPIKSQAQKEEKEEVKTTKTKVKQIEAEPTKTKSETKKTTKEPKKEEIKKTKSVKKEEKSDDKKTE